MSESLIKIFQQLGFKVNHREGSNLFVLTHRQKPNLYARIITYQYHATPIIQLMYERLTYRETLLSELLFTDVTSWIASG